jgi:transposase-like protein
LTNPRAGIDYPQSTGEFQAWFRTDEDCLDYLEWLRWPQGWRCPSCEGATGWRLGDGRIMCADCGGRTSVTAGTIFDKTRTPLTVWFSAVWLFATGKDGISAQSLKRTLEIGSYQTAWAMLHRVRSVLQRPGRDRLRGVVELDETYIGGEEPGLSGGRARGKKSLVAIAVELKQPRGYGRCRMAVLPDASSATLDALVREHVERGSTVITDGWRGYDHLTAMGYIHDRRSQRAARSRDEDIGELLPGVHRDRCSRQALVPRHPPRLRGAVAPGQLPQRVRLPLQPPHFTQPRARLLPRPGTRCRPCPGPLPRHHRQQASSPNATQTTQHPGTPTDFGPPICRPPLAVRAAPQLQLRLNGYPHPDVIPNLQDPQAAAHTGLGLGTGWIACPT